MLEKDLTPLSEMKKGEYMKRVMTGMEAYRALWHCLELWSEQCGQEEGTFIRWLYTCTETNSIVQKEWEQGIRMMIEERESGNEDEAHAYKLPNMAGVLKPC